MKILLVIDQFDSANNGTTISAKRFAETLVRHGNEVRVVSTGEKRDGKYAVSELKIPFFDGLIKSQGMQFARPNKAVLREAIAWADVVHFLMPFALGRVGRRIAMRQGVPCTAAFHVQPENITSSIGMKNATAVNDGIYRYFNRKFYHYFDHIHCPSRFIASEMKRHGYRSQLHVISNGIENDFCYRKMPKTPELEGKYVILMIGRLSVEKRQDLLIEGIRRSRHCGEIQLILAGQGPKLHAVSRLGATLPNPPIIRFYTKEELKDVIAMSDLYVHAADIEIEAISCIEAFAGGLVPVIANSPRSATPQFALDDRSLFHAGNADDLAKKIDYWVEHPKEKAEMETRYAQHGRAYCIDACVDQIEEMFRESIREAGHAV
ncbi:MAG: glycosyltransferase [Eubacteriales bacterium]|nr:glycosyltransferase [Eubacteriales bacterium]